MTCALEGDKNATAHTQTKSTAGGSKGDAGTMESLLAKTGTGLRCFLAEVLDRRCRYATKREWHSWDGCNGGV
jgi:hypothetical protein